MVFGHNDNILRLNSSGPTLVVSMAKNQFRESQSFRFPANIKFREILLGMASTFRETWQFDRSLLKTDL